MPEKCEIHLRHRKSKRVSKVTKDAYVDKKPALAPKHRKPDAQIVKDLTDKIDQEISSRNSRPPPLCSAHDCDFLGEKKIDEWTIFRVIHLIWTEKFELRDADGNIIKGTAKYLASGTAEIRTKVYERTCDARLGDDPSDFYETAYDPDKPTIIITPGWNLKDTWKHLPEDQREDMELIEGEDDE